MSTTPAVSAVSAQGERSSGVALFMGRLFFGALLLVLAMTPFEAGYPPLGRILWATYTNLEITLFVLATVWVALMLVEPGARRRFFRMPLLVPLIAFLAATVLSMLVGQYQETGVRYIYRTLMGVLVVAAAWEALRSRQRLVIAALTSAAAAVVSAGLGVLEFAEEINIESWLRIFKPQPTTVGGMLRLTGTFEYANGAAAYFEMVLPILAGLVLLFSSSPFGEVLGVRALSEWKRRAAQIGLYAALALCAIALVLTFSRAAWVGAAVGVVVFAAGLLIRKGVPRRWWAALGLSAAVIALGAVLVLATQPLFRLRLLGENDRDWYRNTIVSAPLPTLSAGDVVTVPVTVRNDSPITWQADRRPVVNLSYHWRDPDKVDYVIFEGERSSLPHDLRPGEIAQVQAVVWAPSEPGEYQLEWDLVQENVTWFFQKSRVRAPLVSVTVRPASAGAEVKPPPSIGLPSVNVEAVENYDTSTVPRTQLWAVAWKMFQAHPLTGVGPDGFRHLYGEYAGTRFWNRNIYTNSTYVEMFTNLGIFGGLSFLWVLGAAVWRGARNVLRLPVGGVWLLVLGATSAVLALALHGLVDYFLFATPLYVTFWFLVGIAIRDQGSVVSANGQPANDHRRKGAF